MTWKQERICVQVFWKCQPRLGGVERCFRRWCHQVRFILERFLKIKGCIYMYILINTIQELKLLDMVDFGFIVPLWVGNGHSLVVVQWWH